jgi:hypothetical protein
LWKARKSISFVAAQGQGYDSIPGDTYFASYLISVAICIFLTTAWKLCIISKNTVLGPV